MTTPEAFSPELVPLSTIESIDDFRARLQASLQLDAELIETSRSAIASTRILLTDIEHAREEAGALTPRA